MRRFTQMDPNEPKWTQMNPNGPKWRPKWTQMATQMAIKVEKNYNKILITNIITCFSHVMGLLAVIKKNKDPNGDLSGKQL